MDHGTDALALGQRVVAVLETGLRTATYKLATLQALIDYCVENLPTEENAALSVSLTDLGARVIEAYWPQVRPFEGHELRQSTQPTSRILRAVVVLQAEGRARGITGVPDRVAELLPGPYRRTLNEVVVTLVQQPLNRLQRLPGRHQADERRFLYDDSWMTDSTSWRTIQRRGARIELYPGVAAGLARLSGLLRPVIQMLWAEDVRNMNRTIVDADAPDIAGHLFGRSRVSLEPARHALIEAFGPSCFYCQTQLRGSSQVDHVLPWGRIGIDGLANLVTACARCNSDKRHALPALPLVTAALGRDRSTLADMSRSINWPVQLDRTRKAARGLYLAEPLGTPTWRGYKSTEPLTIPDPQPSWLA